MKNIIAIFAVALVTVTFTGCKTTEANYRAAYEKAKTKGESTIVDKEVYDQIAKEEAPSDMNVGGVTFPARRLPVTPVDIDDLKPGTILQFNVAVGRFRQTFNAKSLARRLRENGYPDAFVAKDREGAYYVIATSKASAQEASDALSHIITLKNLGILNPFPYMIVR